MFVSLGGKCVYITLTPFQPIVIRKFYSLPTSIHLNLLQLMLVEIFFTKFFPENLFLTKNFSANLFSRMIFCKYFFEKICVCKIFSQKIYFLGKSFSRNFFQFFTKNIFRKIYFINFYFAIFSKKI